VPRCIEGLGAFIFFLPELSVRPGQPFSAPLPWPRLRALSRLQPVHLFSASADSDGGFAAPAWFGVRSSVGLSVDEPDSGGFPSCAMTLS